MILYLLSLALSANAWGGEPALLRNPFHLHPHPKSTPGSLASYACPVAPPAVKDISANSYYTDEAKSVIDPVLKKQDEEAVRPLEDYLRTFSRMTDDYVRSGATPAIGSCALDWLNAWAGGRALLGNMTNNQSEYERKWILAGLALNYLKIRDDAALDPTKKKRVEDWLHEVAGTVIAFFKNTNVKHNNHYYWAGLAVAASGVATNDGNLLNWGVATYREALTQIGSDGTLPLELARAGKALSYHNYSVAPLVLIAELAEANGIDLYGEGQGAFQRLVKRTVEGLQNPRFFEKRTGVSQEVPKGGILGWMEPYEARFPDPSIRSLKESSRPLIYPKLGGDLTLLSK